MRLLSKVPSLRLEDTAIDAATVSFILATTSLPTSCPLGDQQTVWLHSHYQGTVADLLWSGRHVKLLLRVREFCGSRKGYLHRVFTERLPDLIESYARKTVRLHEVLELVSFALGGEA